MPGCAPGPRRSGSGSRGSAAAEGPPRGPSAPDSARCAGSPPGAQRAGRGQGAPPCGRRRGASSPAPPKSRAPGEAIGRRPQRPRRHPSRSGLAGRLRIKSESGRLDSPGGRSADAQRPPRARTSARPETRRSIDAAGRTRGSDGPGARNRPVDRLVAASPPPRPGPPRARSPSGHPAAGAPWSASDAPAPTALGHPGGCPVGAARTDAASLRQAKARAYTHTQLWPGPGWPGPERTPSTRPCILSRARAHTHTHLFCPDRLCAARAAARQVTADVINERYYEHPVQKVK